MKKIYVDTNIFLDFWFNRNAGLKPAGLFAKELFDKTRECKYFLIISNFILKEIELNIKFQKVAKDFFDGFRKLGKLKVVKITQSMIDTAKNLKSETPTHDKIHGLVAKQENAILVTRDKHFKQLQNILGIPVRAPEEL